MIRRQSGNVTLHSGLAIVINDPDGPGNALPESEEGHYTATAKRKRKRKAR